MVEAALDSGITFFDTADIYGGTRSEEFLGRILEGRRDRVVLATKFGMPIDEARPGGARPAYVRRALEESLRRLPTDRIDLYQLHQPDEDTRIGDTLHRLAELVAEGKVREIGCSNFSAQQLREAHEAVGAGEPRFVSVQNELNLLQRADLHEALPEAQRLGLAYIPYFPLASGLLTGKYRRDRPPASGHADRRMVVGAHLRPDRRSARTCTRPGQSARKLSSPSSTWTDRDQPRRTGRYA